LDPATDSIVRTILKASVFDCSVVTDPAYLASDASVRSQLPEGDAALRALAAEKRAALTQSVLAAEQPSSDDVERWRLQLQLEELL
jgi:phage head maturation protease